MNILINEPVCTALNQNLQDAQAHRGTNMDHHDIYKDIFPSRELVNKNYASYKKRYYCRGSRHVTKDMSLDVGGE